MSDDETAHSITIKPPQFCETSARGWFAVLEAQFKIKNIKKSSTKFYSALSALPPAIVTNIPEQILSDEKYDELKNNVIGVFEQTKPEIFEKLAQKTTMTGRPSLYLQELQTLARKAGIGDCQDSIRYKFLSALPQTIAPAVAAQTSVSLVQLGSIADELMPLHTSFCNLSLKSSDHKSEPKQDRSSGKFSPRIPFGLRPFSADQRPKVCRAHIYFTDKARTCKPWCKFPNKSNCRMEPSRTTSPAGSTENLAGGSN